MPRFVLGLLLLILALAPLGLTAQQGAPPEYIPYEDWERPLFSQMVIVDRTIYLSGMMGVSPPDWNIVPGGIQPESRQAMENIRSALTRVGAGMDDIVKCTIFLIDMSDWVSMNEVYLSFFSGDLPARSAVAVAGLGLHGKVEIECIAVRPTR
jgi:2-iminobutanoate/2-iminopropanoate deaminase